MLRLVRPEDRFPPTAYPVPWLIASTTNPQQVRAINAGPDALERVTVTLLSSGELLRPHAARVLPGEEIDIGFPRGSPISSAVALITWTAHGEEYLYRVAR